MMHLLYKIKLSQLFICLFFINISYKTNGATHWRFEQGEVLAIFGEEDKIFKNDAIFKILSDATNPRINNDLSYSLSTERKLIANALQPYPLETSAAFFPSTTTAIVPSISAFTKFKNTALTCGEPVNETLMIDHLPGIRNRFIHPSFPEPDVALMFKRNQFDNIQTEVLENNLSEALKSGENCIILYNTIGNLLRIHGDTYHAIECFRKALHLTNNTPDPFLNLARLLTNLNYLNDAEFLARHSLDIQSSALSNWIQHYALAEILERKGDLNAAWNHYHAALEENPRFDPIKVKLSELNPELQSTTIDVCTIAVIIVLCIVILIYLSKVI